MATRASSSISRASSSGPGCERRRLFDRLAARFSPRQIEELIWRTTQCVAFNWHNDLLELDPEPEVTLVTRDANHG